MGCLSLPCLVPQPSPEPLALMDAPLLPVSILRIHPTDAGFFSAKLSARSSVSSRVPAARFASAGIPLRLTRVHAGVRVSRRSGAEGVSRHLGKLQARSGGLLFFVLAQSRSDHPHKGHYGLKDRLRPS